MTEDRARLTSCWAAHCTQVTGGSTWAVQAAALHTCPSQHCKGPPARVHRSVQHRTYLPSPVV